MRPVARPMNTVGAVAYSAGARSYIRLYSIRWCIIHILCVCVCVRACVYKFKRRLCQEHKINTQLHKAICNTAQNISHIHIVLKMSSFNHSCSTEATRGCGRFSRVVQRADRHVCVWYFANCYWGASRFLQSAACTILTYLLTYSLHGAESFFRS